MLAPSASRPATSWRTRLPFYYGWVIVGSLAAAQAFALGIHYSFSVFLVALTQGFGWDRGSTAGALSIALVVQSIGGVFAGGLIDRFGPSRTIPLGGVLIALGLAATSQMTELWQFYLFFSLTVGFGISMVGMVPAAAIASNWFSLKRGLAMGVSSAGIGVGIVVVVPFSQYLVSTFGWRSAYEILAAAVLVGIAPQAALLQVAGPATLGLHVDGRKEETRVESRAEVRPSDSRPSTLASPAPSTLSPQSSVLSPSHSVLSPQSSALSSALGTHRFWFLALAAIGSAFTNQTMWTHQVAYFVDVGYDAMLAASIVGVVGLVSIPAKILLGTASDRFGRELSYGVGMGSVVLAVLTLMVIGVAPVVPLLFLFATFFGAGYAVAASVAPAAAADVFGGRGFGSVYGAIVLGTCVGSAFGTWSAGYVFDVTGSYMAAFVAGVASSTLSATCMWLAAPRKWRRPRRAANARP